MEQSYTMIALRVLGALGLLIFGMKMMSEALQKMAGPQLRYILAKMTTNRLTGMLTGTFVTCAVQSSSAEHWHNAHGLDYVVRLFGRSYQCGLSCIFRWHDIDLQEKPPLRGRFPFWHSFPFSFVGDAQCCWS